MVLLPPELWQHILAYLQDDDDRHALRTCCLVSSEWRSLVTPLLFQDISLEWTSKPGLALIETLDQQPHYPSYIRSFRTNFPKLSVIVGDDYRAYVHQEQEWLWWHHLASLDEAERPSRSQADFETIRRAFMASLSYERVTNSALRRAYGDVQTRWPGHEEWMDNKVWPEDARREGCRQLFALLGRLHRLTHLDLGNIDWGNVNGENESPYLAPLPSVRRLEFHERQTGSSYFNRTLLLFLNNAPNAEHLSIDYDYGDPFPALDSPLRHLHTLTLRYVLKGPLLVSIVLGSAHALRKIEVAHLWPSREASFARELLSLTTGLESLLLYYGNIEAEYLKEKVAPELEEFVTSSTTLKHLALLCTPYPALVNHLPATLETLRLFVPTTLESFSPICEALYRAKEIRVPQLGRVELARVSLGGNGGEYSAYLAHELAIEVARWEDIYHSDVDFELVVNH